MMAATQSNRLWLSATHKLRQYRGDADIMLFGRKNTVTALSMAEANCA
jgi:hypothetical protein